MIFKSYYHKLINQIMLFSVSAFRLIINFCHNIKLHLDIINMSLMGLQIISRRLHHILNESIGTYTYISSDKHVLWINNLLWLFFFILFNIKRPLYIQCFIIITQFVAQPLTQTHTLTHKHTRIAVKIFSLSAVEQVPTWLHAFTRIIITPYSCIYVCR